MWEKDRKKRRVERENERDLEKMWKEETGDENERKWGRVKRLRKNIRKKFSLGMKLLLSALAPNNLRSSVFPLTSDNPREKKHKYPGLMLFKQPLYINHFTIVPRASKYMTRLGWIFADVIVVVWATNVTWPNMFLIRKRIFFILLMG